jgi:hypothetical protein
MQCVPTDQITKRPDDFFPAVDYLIKMQDAERLKSEAFIMLINFINTQFTGKYDNMETVTKTAMKILPTVEKFIMEKMTEAQIDSL